MIKLYDSRSRAKQEFRPLTSGKPGLYVCGPTVYDLIHIGNARPLLVFDLLFRLLRRAYGAEAVTYVRNITDVDDKINHRAQEAGVSIRELTETTEKAFRADAKGLGCLKPTREPRATDHIAEMITLIEILIEKGFAYASEGHVLFHVKAFEAYGGLSKRALDDMIAGARVEVAPYKQDPLDFVLWKPSSDDLPGWDSPWGRGRPGWHIECSAMAWKWLGTAVDIHGGGIDLIFPHHENEEAQSCAAHGTDCMANIWMHNGFLQVEGEKMSKSLGNFITVKQALETNSPAAVRLAMFSTLYRQPIDWTKAALGRAEKTLLGWKNLLEETQPSSLDEEVLAALEDDLNTPKAIARLHQLANEGRQKPESLAKLAASLDFIGFDLTTLRARESEPSMSPEEVEAKLIARREARAGKDFALADQIRDELTAAGIVIMDSAGGTAWEYR